MTTIGSLFAGYGGLDLAVGMLGPVRTAWVADIEPSPRTVLAHRFPDAPNLGDVTTVDWGRVKPVDIRSGLWESMAAAIHRLTPPVVIWENVVGALSARFVEWMMGLPEGWVTGAPGVSRTAQLRMLGNGVVPQQAAHALTILADWAPLDGAPPADTDELGTPDMLADLMTGAAA